MGKAARAIIIKNGKILVMHRNKFGSQYFTLIGGRVSDGETVEQALIREVKEETGLDVTAARLVFTEEHAAPYNEQYVFLCELGSHDGAAIQDSSEEGQMNKLDMNVHKLTWLNLDTFAHVPFRTPQLQTAITKGLKKGFPSQPQKL